MTEPIVDPLTLPTYCNGRMRPYVIKPVKAVLAGQITPGWMVMVVRVGLRWWWRRVLSVIHDNLMLSVLLLIYKWISLINMLLDSSLVPLNIIVTSFHIEAVTGELQIQTGSRVPPEGIKGVHRCTAAVALYRGNSWGLHLQLYYLNCLGKYVQWLYYQFMASLATPLIQQLKHCNWCLKLSAGGA